MLTDNLHLIVGMYRLKVSFTKKIIYSQVYFHICIIEKIDLFLNILELNLVSYKLTSFLTRFSTKTGLL